MSEEALRGFLKEQHQGIETIAQKAIEREGTGAVVEIAAFLTSLATQMPILGSIAKLVLSKALAEPANAILEEQIKDWKQEQQFQDLLRPVTNSLETLIFDAMAATMRSQNTSTADVLDTINDSLIQFCRKQERLADRIEENISSLLGKRLSDLLTKGTRLLPRDPSPAALLNAHFGVVPFLDSLRVNEIAKLSNWLGDPNAPPIETLVGGGGSGKTRLAIDLCRQVGETEGWVAGFLQDGREEDLLTHFFRTTFSTCDRVVAAWT